MEIAALTKATDKITINSSAFRGCSSLTSVTLSKNVTTINTSAFGNCAKLTTFNTDANTNFEAKNGLLYKADGTIICIPAGLVFDKNEIALGEDDKIGAGALDGCVNLKKLILPESITTIADKYFLDAKYLEEIVISSKTESIGNYAFDGSGLKKITYNGYKSDEAETLKTSVFPATLKTIGKQAFRETQLEKVILPETLNGVTFTSNGRINTSSVAAGAFSGSALKSVVIEGAETYLGGSATATDGVFSNCVNLTDVRFLKDTAQFGQNMFNGCSALTTVTLPAGAETLAASMFQNCEALTSVTLPAGTKTLAASMFQNCKALTSVTLPANITSIPSSLFRDSGITEIVIPEGVTEILYDAFSGCTKLTNVTLPSTLTSLGGRVFKGCTELTSVQIPEGIETLDGFTDCTKLQSINIPDTVTTISSGAFDNCTSLKSIVIPESVTTVKVAFSGWTAEQTIYVERSASEVYNLWNADKESGFGWMIDVSTYSGEKQTISQCFAKIVWNYSPEATTAGENAK